MTSSSGERTSASDLARARASVREIWPGLLALAGGLFDAAGIGDPRQWLQVTFIAGVLAWIGALAVRTWQVR